MKQQAQLCNLDTTQDATKPARPYSVPVYRVSLVRETSIPMEYPVLRTSRDSAQLFRCHLGEDADREHFMVAMLDTKNRVIGINTVSIGSLSASVVTPRETFKAAIVANAGAIILCHNHPSGDTTPSQTDREITHQLFESGKIIGIAVLDHLVIGDGTSSYFSFADNGELR